MEKTLTPFKFKLSDLAQVFKNDYNLPVLCYAMTKMLHSNGYPKHIECATQGLYLALYDAYPEYIEFLSHDPCRSYIPGWLEPGVSKQIFGDRWVNWLSRDSRLKILDFFLEEGGDREMTLGYCYDADKFVVLEMWE